MKYNPTTHAVERIRERFGIMEEHAKNFVNQLMETALYVTTNPNGTKVYKHTGKDVMLAVNTKTNTVITILPPANEGEHNKYVKANVNNYIIEKARTTIQREIAKTKRQFTREFRTLAERQALVQIEIAEMTLRKARAKNPNTQARIQANIDVALGLFDEIGSAISELQAEFERTKREAQAFLQTEVTA